MVTAVLLDPARHIGQVHELTGPRSQDMNGIAQEYSRALGREVTYEDVPADLWVDQVAAHAGLPQHVVDHLVTMTQLHRENRYDRSTRTVEEIAGSPAQSVEEFVAERAGTFTRPSR